MGQNPDADYLHSSSPAADCGFQRPVQGPEYKPVLAAPAPKPNRPPPTTSSASRKTVFMRQPDGETGANRRPAPGINQTGAPLQAGSGRHRRPAGRFLRQRLHQPSRPSRRRAARYLCRLSLLRQPPAVCRFTGRRLRAAQRQAPCTCTAPKNLIPGWTSPKRSARKIAALKQHASQLGDWDPAEEMTKWAEESGKKEENQICRILQSDASDRETEKRVTQNVPGPYNTRGCFTNYASRIRPRNRPPPHPTVIIGSSVPLRSTASAPAVPPPGPNSAFRLFLRSAPPSSAFDVSQPALVQVLVANLAHRPQASTVNPVGILLRLAARPSSVRHCQAKCVTFLPVGVKRVLRVFAPGSQSS